MVIANLHRRFSTLMSSNNIEFCLTKTLDEALTSLLNDDEAVGGMAAAEMLARHFDRLLRKGINTSTHGASLHNSVSPLAIIIAYSFSPFPDGCFQVPQ